MNNNNWFMAPALNRPAAAAAAACPEHVCARHGQYFTRRRGQERRLGAFGWMMMVELGETRANNNNGGGWCGGAHSDFNAPRRQK